MAKRTKAVETPEDAQLRKVAQETVREMLGYHLIQDRLKRAEVELDALRREVQEAAVPDESDALAKAWMEVPFGVREQVIAVILSSGYSTEACRFYEASRRLTDPEVTA